MTIIKINNLPPDAGLKPGMTAQVTIKVKTIPNVLMVPVQSVSQHKSKHYTYVVKDRDVAKRDRVCAFHLDSCSLSCSRGPGQRAGCRRNALRHDH